MYITVRLLVNSRGFQFGFQIVIIVREERIRARSDDSDDLDSAVARLRKSGIKAI
jgi:hypothetical protein